MYNLRIICLTQFSEERRGSSYSFDDGGFLVTQIADLQKNLGDDKDEDDQFVESLEVPATSELDKLQKDVIYHIAGILILIYRATSSFIWISFQASH